MAGSRQGWKGLDHDWWVSDGTATGIRRHGPNITRRSVVLSTWSLPTGIRHLEVPKESSLLAGANGREIPFLLDAMVDFDVDVMWMWSWTSVWNLYKPPQCPPNGQILIRISLIHSALHSFTHIHSVSLKTNHSLQSPGRFLFPSSFSSSHLPLLIFLC